MFESVPTTHAANIPMANAVDVNNLSAAITSVLAEHDVLREENEHLKSSLSAALRRVERAEAILAASQNGAPSALAEAQSRLESEQAAHDATRSHLRSIQEQWADLDRYANLLDVRMVDARSMFANLLGNAPPKPLPRAAVPLLHAPQEARAAPALPPTTLPPYRQHMDTLQDLPSAQQSPRSLPRSALHSPHAMTRALQPSYVAAAYHPSRAPAPEGPAGARGPPRSRSMSVEDMLLDAADAASPYRRAEPVPTNPRRPRVIDRGRLGPSAGSSRSLSRTRLMDDRTKRICRQCGLPGRLKDGRCVEKWGPGPDGPGTVCDRCRKKIKRVEKRETALAYPVHPPIAAIRSTTHSPERAAVHASEASHSSSSEAGAAGMRPAHDDLMDTAEMADDGEDELLETADMDGPQPVQVTA